MVVKDKEKCVVMFSGGLDSRLAIKLMQEKGFEVLAVYFHLPFGEGCCNKGCSFNFAQLQGVELKIIDCSKGKLLQEYLDVVKKAAHGTGAGVNPCVDCRIFMFKKGKEIADKKSIKFVVTGEVLDQRPMSQRKKQMEIIEKETDLAGRIIRPLCDLGFCGRRRVNQMELAKKFNIKYPEPAGGCLLCEKELKKRLGYLLKRGMNDEEVSLVGIGRHFLIDERWVVLGRNHVENLIIENFKGAIVPKELGPSVVVLDKCNGGVDKKVSELVFAYSKKGSLKERKTFEKYRL